MSAAVLREAPLFYRPTGRHPSTVWDRLELPASGGQRLLAEIHKGLPVAILASLRREIGEPTESLLRLIDLSTRTLARRQIEGVLKPDESDRVVRLINVLASAEALFEGDSEAARQWLHQPAKGLGGVAPLTMAETEAGAREVLNLIGRLEHGVFA